jgi:uncharacterized protein YukE
MKKAAKPLSIAVLASFILGFFWVIYNAQAVIDWWTLRGYVPSEAIVEVASSASLNDEGRRLFYIYDPQLLPKENFFGKCEVGEETIVLGCYISTDKIYLLDVNEPRLEGVEEVTAAHEMLHVVYDRLSQSEREELDTALLEHFNNLNNERLNSTIENYRKRDPSVVPNELHSILGTEYRNLPEKLEEHYQKYFIDRLVVVSLAEAYSQEFERRENQIKEYDAQLDSLNSSIEQTQTDLELKSVALQQERNNLESLRRNPDAFNAAVPVYNASVNEFNSELEELKSLISRYNQTVEERNVVALEEKELVKAIDSRLSEIE